MSRYAQKSHACTPPPHMDGGVLKNFKKKFFWELKCPDMQRKVMFAHHHSL